jgi:tetratricopeptide (TPR) repeat protein
MLTTLVELEGSADVQERCYFGFATAQLLFAEGRFAEALSVAESVLAHRQTLGLELDAIEEAFVLALQATLELGQPDRAEQLLRSVEELAPGRRPQFVNANIARFRAHLEQNAEETDRLFKGAAGLLQELGIPFYIAVTRLEHAEWLCAQGRKKEAQPLLAEARGILERLQATPWLERLDRVDADRPPAPNRLPGTASMRNGSSNMARVSTMLPMRWSQSTRSWPRCATLVTYP